MHKGFHFSEVLCGVQQIESISRVDGNAVVFNNAFQPLTVRSGSVPLTQGSHSIFIAYYQGGGQYGMYADVQVPGGTLQRIPNALLNTYANLQIGSLGGAGSVVIAGSNSLTVGGSNNKTARHNLPLDVFKYCVVHPVDEIAEHGCWR